MRALGLALAAIVLSSAPALADHCTPGMAASGAQGVACSGLWIIDDRAARPAMHAAPQVARLSYAPDSGAHIHAHSHTDAHGRSYTHTHYHAAEQGHFDGRVVRAHPPHAGGVRLGDEIQLSPDFASQLSSGGGVGTGLECVGTNTGRGVVVIRGGGRH